MRQGQLSKTVFSAKDCEVARPGDAPTEPQHEETGFCRNIFDNMSSGIQNCVLISLQDGYFSLGLRFWPLFPVCMFLIWHA